MLTSLSHRLILSCILPLIVIGSVYTYFAFRQTENKINEQIATNGSLISSALMSSGSQALVVNRKDFIDQTAVEAILNQDNILAIEWLTLERKSFLKIKTPHSVTPDSETVQEYEIYYRPLKTVDAFNEDLQIDDGTLEEANSFGESSTPEQVPEQSQAANSREANSAEPKLTGYLKVVFNKTAMEQKANKTLYYQLGIILAIFFVTLLLATFNAYRLSRGLKKLFNFIKHLSVGSYTDQLSREGSDELAELSGSLNDLSRTLESNQRDIKLERERLNDAIVELTKARNETDKANGWLKQMLGVLSHEMRTPLNAVVAPLEMVLNKTNQPFSARLLENAISHVDEVLAQLDNVMDYTQLERGIYTIDKSPTDLQVTINHVVANYQLVAEQKGLTLNCQYTGNPELLNAYYNVDRQRLTQIIINLISNAIKYSHQGEINLTWQLRSLDPQHCDIIIELSDQGIGIPHDKLKDIFEMFHQVDSNISRQYGGMGIGLGLSKKYADLFGGQLSVRSQLEKGSTFTLSFTAEKVLMAVTTVPLPSNQEMNFTKSINVLIVEDNIDNCNVLCHLLKRIAPNIQLTTECDGQAALDLITDKPFPYEIVLIDIHLPKISGLDIIKRIREKNPSVNIIAVTADTSFTNQEACFEAGASQFVKKPVRLLNIANIFSALN